MTMRLSSEQVLARVKSLPALPQAVHELGEALRCDTVQVDRIVGVVASDQALTVAALRLANSSFYGVSGRVTSLRDAIQILGLHTLAAAVMTAAVMSCFDRSACAAFDFDGCWRHAIASALCTQRLAQTRGLDADEAYTAGLLHDIGRLALASHFPNQFGAALAWGAAHEQAPIDAEREVLGVDHAEVGAMVAQHWRLAPAIVDAIRHHHELPAGAQGGVVDVLHLADNITHALDLAGEADDLVPTLSLAVWERVGVSGPELQQLFAYLEDRMAKLGRVGG